jgi:hypothetical protein
MDTGVADFMAHQRRSLTSSSYVLAADRTALLVENSVGALQRGIA